MSKRPIGSEEAKAQEERAQNEKARKDRQGPIVEEIWESNGNYKEPEGYDRRLYNTLTAHGKARTSRVLNERDLCQKEGEELPGQKLPIPRGRSVIQVKGSSNYRDADSLKQIIDRAFAAVKFENERAGRPKFSIIEAVAKHHGKFDVDLVIQFSDQNALDWFVRNYILSFELVEDTETAIVIYDKRFDEEAEDRVEEEKVALEKEITDRRKRLRRMSKSRSATPKLKDASEE